MIRETIIQLLLSAAIMTGFVMFLFPMMGTKATFYSIFLTFVGGYFIAWGLARVLAGQSSKMAWTIFAAGIVALILMWGVVF
jgi:heme O synthase-like polyprenyltransferase